MVAWLLELVYLLLRIGSAWFENIPPGLSESKLAFLPKNLEGNYLRSYIWQFSNKMGTLAVWKLQTAQKPCKVMHKLKNLIKKRKKKVHKLWFEMKSTTQWVGYFKTISGHFFGNYINISHRTEVLTVILICLTYLNPYLIKNYDIKHNFCHFQFFSIL